jgi:hypothetical protein
MFVVSCHTAIARPWITMPRICLGTLPSGLGTADLYVTISDDDRPVLRVDLYAGQWRTPFKDAIAWEQRVFVGYGDAVYVIDPQTRSSSTITLGSYFAAFYVARDHLLVASGGGLLRLSSNGEVMWRVPGLGLDGVLVSVVENSLVKGSGEWWDPPGGWRPFVLRLDSGELVS